jgi:hypothetical protein
VNEQIDPSAAIGVFLIGGFIVLISLASFAFWLWMLIDCISKEPDTNNQKVIWIVAIVVFGLLGAFVYNIARRPQRIREYGR